MPGIRQILRTTLALGLLIAGVAPIPGLGQEAEKTDGATFTYTRIYTHRATMENTTSFVTTLDDTLLNDNPRAIVVVTQNFNPGGGGGGVYNDHPIGVGYSGSRWSIFNEDGAPIPEGAAFNVWIGPGALLRTAAENTYTSWSVLDWDETNRNPEARIFATHNYTLSGPSGMAHPYTLAAFYNATEYWCVANADGAVDMPLDIGFNLFSDPRGTVQLPTASTAVGNQFPVDLPEANGQPDAILFAISTSTPTHPITAIDAHNIGVWYDGARWAIFHQDIAPMPSGVGFNVVAYRPPTIDVAFLRRRKLYVRGRNFVPGSTIVIGGVPVATRPDPTDPTLLVANRARRRLTRGTVTSIEVRTPDNVLSRPYGFDRPD